MEIAIWQSRQGTVCTRTKRAQQDIENLKTQVELYQIYTGFLPSTTEGLQALISPPIGLRPPAKWKQFLTELPLDPWGTPYQYRCPAAKSHHGRYDLFSGGPDKLLNTADDIGNW